jgi:hypothetical protein
MSESQKHTDKKTGHKHRTGKALAALASVGLAAGITAASLKNSSDAHKSALDKAHNLEIVNGENIYAKYRYLPTKMTIRNRAEMGPDGKALVIAEYEGFGLTQPIGALIENGETPGKEMLQEAQSPNGNEQVYYWATKDKGTTEYKPEDSILVMWEQYKLGDMIVTISTRDDKYSGTYGFSYGDSVTDSSGMYEYPLFHDGGRELAIELIKAEQDQAGR